MSAAGDVTGSGGEDDLRSTRPYLVRAIFDWCIDGGLTPQIMANVEMPEVIVPLDYAKDGKIVLNLHPSSVRNLELGNDYLMFSARFAGRAEDIIVPITAVMAVYARENGQGIVFQADGSSMTPPEPPSLSPVDGEGRSGQTGQAGEGAGPSGPKRAGGHLKVVK